MRAHKQILAVTGLQMRIEWERGREYGFQCEPRTLVGERVADMKHISG